MFLYTRPSPVSRHSSDRNRDNTLLYDQVMMTGVLSEKPQQSKAVLVYSLA
jgi:hypothetical protein